VNAPHYPTAVAPDREHDFLSDDIRLRVFEWGDVAAPPILLTHELWDTARGFDTFAPHFTDTYRVVALDARGHGDSDWLQSSGYYPEPLPRRSRGRSPELVKGRSRGRDGALRKLRPVRPRDTCRRERARPVAVAQTLQTQSGPKLESFDPLSCTASRA
jgi:pimeloyl-ACP methyl ester carboxylesterase